MNSIINDIKHSFKTGDILIRLIYVNLAVFLALQLLRVISFFVGTDIFSLVFYWLVLPSDLSLLITRPWTIITHFFVHIDFFHLLFNLLWLYSGGKIFSEYLGDKRLQSTYFLGGLTGGLFYLLSYSLFPTLSYNQSIGFGASASVLAIFIAVATHTPNLLVQLPLIGSFKIKYIAIGFIILDFVSIPNFNSGGHIAHLGGALFGYLYIKQYQKGNDLSNYFFTAWNYIVALYKSVATPKQKIKVAYSNTQKKTSDDFEYNAKKVEQQKIVDKILEKISKSGYESLSKQEKEILFNASSKK